MPKDTMTLALSGEIELGIFAIAISNFENLARVLSRNADAEGIKWMICDLQVSSAIATVHGEGDILVKVERVVNDYESLGNLLQQGKLPEKTNLARPVKAITGILGEKVTSIRFETPDKDFVIVSKPELVSAYVINKSFGAIEGRIQTLSNRKGLRFVLYDVLHDRAVSCYLSEGQEEKMREGWGKKAIVEGEISREVETGRPLAIRHIADIKILPETERGGYLRARGIAPRNAGSPLPEFIIRESRDA
jgi:hypothetical protein